MKFNELFKKVKVANELNYENYQYYRFTDYRQFTKAINEEFIPEIVKGLKEVEFEINKEFVITYQDFRGKTCETIFKVELI